MEEGDVVHFWVVVHQQLLGENVPRHVSMQVGVPAIRIVVTLDGFDGMYTIYMYIMALSACRQNSGDFRWF